ncbi:hypothetical protein SZ54_0384 [Rhizobium sp. UR51a]|nr:hypothetical protein SZ54_0384 [Rhizobium sp. UR51a]
MRQGLRALGRHSQPIIRRPKAIDGQADRMTRGDRDRICVNMAGVGRSGFELIFPRNISSRHSWNI